MPIRQPLAKSATILQLLALRPQRVVPPLQLLAVRDPCPPPLSVLLQGLVVPPLLPSAVCAYTPLLW